MLCGCLPGSHAVACRSIPALSWSPDASAWFARWYTLRGGCFCTGMRPLRATSAKTALSPAAGPLPAAPEVKRFPLTVAASRRRNERSTECGCVTCRTCRHGFRSAVLRRSVRPSAGAQGRWRAPPRAALQVGGYYAPALSATSIWRYALICSS